MAQQKQVLRDQKSVNERQSETAVLQKEIVEASREISKKKKGSRRAAKAEEPVAEESVEALAAEEAVEAPAEDNAQA